MKMHRLHLPLAVLSLALTAADVRAQSGLARERGLSQTESTAVGAVLRQVAGASGKSGATVPAPSRRVSPDYYRVYSRRMQAAGVPQRVAVATPAPAKTKVPPANTPAPARRVAVVAPEPRPAKLKAPPPVPPKPTPARRVAVAPPPVQPVKVKAQPAVTPRPVVAKRVAVAPAPLADRRQPRVAVNPPAPTPRRVAVAPAKPQPAAAPLAKRKPLFSLQFPTPAPKPAPGARTATIAPRRVLMLPPAAKPPVATPAPGRIRRGAVAPTPAPKRVLFFGPGGN